MKVPLCQPGRVLSLADAEVLEAIEGVVRSERWLNGPHTDKFADAFSQWIGAPYCLPVANGTDALELALRAIANRNEPVGKEVITVANAGGYTTAACHQIGLTPVYVDVDEASQLVDFESLIAALNDQTLAIVVTHLYGGVVDVPKLRSLVDDIKFPNVPILEDCAQAHGATIAGQRVGTLGDIAAFSFYPTKNLGAMGDAGAIVTSDPVLHETARGLHQYGWSHRFHVALAGGRNSRMDELQAAILIRLLPYVDNWNQRRRDVLAAYREVCGSSVALLEYDTSSAAHLAVALCGERDAFRSYMSDRDIGTDIHYPVLDCDQPGWTDLPQRIGPTGLTVSRRSVSQIVTLPCFPFMTEDEVAWVADALRDWEQT